MRKRLIVVGVAVLVLALVAIALLRWRESQRTDLERAVATVPAGAQRLSWTNWKAVRDELGADVSASSSADELERFLGEGYDADLTPNSALLQSAPVLQEKFGFSPASADWEMFSQSDRGAVITLHLPDSTDFGELGDRLEALGFTRPSSATGVWKGGADLLNQISPDLTPELQAFALDEDDHLLLASDTPSFLEDAVAAARGQADTVTDLDDVVEASGEPLSAAIYSGDYTCQALAMSQADAGDQQQADELLSAAGKVNPMTGFAMSAQPDDRIRVAMSFENEDQARTNADTRAALARGPAPGQGGDFADRFSVESVTADGPVVTMELRPVEGTYALSDLSTGPVLFATC